MCIQDWQIGRLIRTIRSEVTIASGNTQILQRNKNRVGITFCNGNQQSVYLSPISPYNTRQGIMIPGSSLSGSTGGSPAAVMGGASAITADNSANTLLSANYTGTIDFTGVTISETAGGTFDLFMASRPLHVTLKDYGDLPMQVWYAACPEGGDSITILEYILPDGVLAMTPDQLREAAK